MERRNNDQLKKSISWQDSAMQPLTDPHMAIQTKFPSTSAKYLSHTWWAYEAKLRDNEAEFKAKFGQDDQNGPT